jgi:hypothetical protein
MKELREVDDYCSRHKMQLITGFDANTTSGAAQTSVHKDKA